MIAFHQKLMLRPLLSFPHFNKQLIQIWVQVDAKTLIITFHHNRVVLNLTSLKQHYVISLVIASVISSRARMCSVTRKQKKSRKCRQICRLTFRSTWCFRWEVWAILPLIRADTVALLSTVAWNRSSLKHDRGEYSRFIDALFPTTLWGAVLRLSHLVAT